MTGAALSNLISAAVIAAIVTGLFSLINNRRNARVAERRNVQDEDNDLVTRYKEAAAEERSQKESAVKTVRDLLAIAEGQIDTLRTTIARLTDTITALQQSTAAQMNAQQGLIDDLTTSRDQLQAELLRAQQQIHEQREELLHRQQQILEISYPRSVVDGFRKDMKEN